MRPIIDSTYILSKITPGLRARVIQSPLFGCSNYYCQPTEADTSE